MDAVWGLHLVRRRRALEYGRNIKGRWKETEGVAGATASKGKKSVKKRGEKRTGVIVLARK